MPTYDYVCERGHRFEAFQSMKDDPLTECTDCGAPARRLIGPGAGFLFKGDGFYITDYRSSEYKQKARAETGGDGKSEAKPAASGDGKSTKDSGTSGTSSGTGGGSKSGSPGKKPAD